MAELAFWLKKIVSGLLLVPCGPLLAIAIGLVLAPRRPRTGLALAAFGTLVLFVLATPFVAEGLAAPLERAYPPLPEGATFPADSAIVVLGGGMQLGALDYGGETVNLTTLARLRSAARLARRTHLPVLVSGGRPLTARQPEGRVMADALAQDFATPVRWVEDAALDTDDNARLSAAMLEAAGIGTVVLVTDVEHQPRAGWLFAARGLRVVPAPTDYYAGDPKSILSFIPNPSALRRSAWLIHERVGLAWAHLTH